MTGKVYLYGGGCKNNLVEYSVSEILFTYPFISEVASFHLLRLEQTTFVLITPFQLSLTPFQLSRSLN